MITAASLRSSFSAARFPLGLALLVIALEALGDPARGLLSWDRAGLAAGEGWRLLTGHLVHLGAYHALLNLIGLIALLLLCPAPLPAREWFRRVLLLSLATSAALYLFVPTLSNYVGLSGVLHGLFLLGLLPMALRRDWIAIACLAYLIFKLAWEQVMGAPLSDEKAIGGRVVTQAHLFGTLAALVYGYAFGVFRMGEKTQ
jgi:rhomboid family GlyGly-CTERM serine protease